MPAQHGDPKINSSEPQQTEMEALVANRLHVAARIFLHQVGIMDGYYLHATHISGDDVKLIFLALNETCKQKLQELGSLTERTYPANDESRFGQHYEYTFSIPKNQFLAKLGEFEAQRASIYEQSQKPPESDAKKPATEILAGITNVRDDIARTLPRNTMEIVGREGMDFYSSRLTFIGKLRAGTAGYGYMGLCDELFGFKPFEIGNDHTHFGRAGAALLMPQLLTETGLTLEEAKILIRQHFEVEMRNQIAQHQNPVHGNIAWSHYLQDDKEKLQRWGVYDLAESAYAEYTESTKAKPKNKKTRKTRKKEPKS